MFFCESIDFSRYFQYFPEEVGKLNFISTSSSSAAGVVRCFRVHHAVNEKYYSNAIVNARRKRDTIPHTIGIRTPFKILVNWNFTRVCLVGWLVGWVFELSTSACSLTSAFSSSPRFPLFVCKNEL